MQAFSYIAESLKLFEHWPLDDYLASQGVQNLIKVYILYIYPRLSVGTKNLLYFFRPLTEICLHHGMQYHVYADETQVYLIVEPTEICRQG